MRQAKTPGGISATILVSFICLIITVQLFARTLHANGSKLTHPFLITDANGRRMNVAQQKGKVIFVNFWSLTCIPCKKEMPTISNLANHYKDDTNFLVLPVDLDRDMANDIRYFKENDFALNVYAPAGVVPLELFKGELPTTVIIDKKGRIVLFHPGEGKYDSRQFFHLVDSLSKQ